MSDGVEGPSAHSFRPASFQIRRSLMRVVMPGGLRREASGPCPQQLPQEVHHKIDSARANFYWDAGLKKKYHMVKWEELAKQRDHGGLGFTDTRLMNVCLLSRWIFKLEMGDEDLCCALLRRKYLKDRAFYNSSFRGASQFWKGLREAKSYCQRGLKYILGDGKKIRFWHKVWWGTVLFD
jgi:hypothetical protein